LGATGTGAAVYINTALSRNLIINPVGGNVGIGTDSPTAISTFTTLEIRGATGGGIKIGKTAFAQFNIQHDGTDAYLNNTANGSLYIYTNDTERMRITSDGFARLSASSGGIQFNGDTAAANALDDYEEGTWTPSVGGTATYNAANKGIYTKIGNVVTCQFRVHITLIGTGSASVLSGFPFAAANISDVQSGHCSYYESLAVNTIYLSLYIENNATTAKFAGQATSGATVDNPITLFGNGTIVYGQITYRTS
jgi:hypothetical protein